MVKILDDRERRYNRILELVEMYKLPVLCGKINYPGNDKNTLQADKAFQELSWIIHSNFENDSVYSETLHGFDGSSALIVISLNPLEAKRAAVSLEQNSCMGRIFDIDVYGVDGSPVSRGDLNMPARQCIICGGNARLCIKYGKHSVEEVLKAVNEIIDGCD